MCDKARLATLLRKGLAACACALALLFAGLPLAALAIAEETSPEAASVITSASASGPAQNEPVRSEARGEALLDSAGNLLYGFNELDMLPPASITKVMTAVVALEQGPALDTPVSCVAPELWEDPQMADYGDGDVVTLGELIRVMLVYSANDAAYNVACAVAGSVEAFADLMNAKAAELGMEHTHFMNPHGLEQANHHTCALDFARLARYAMEQHPFIAQTSLMRMVSTTTHGYIVNLKSTNRLLDTLPGIRGIKTGAVTNNYTFIGACGRGDVQLYTAVLGCDTYMGRFNDTASLMEWGFAQFAQVPLTQGASFSCAYPYAFDFGLASVLANKSGAMGSLSPVAGELQSESHLPRQGSLLEVGTTCGYDSWAQGERHVGSSYYDTSPAPTRRSAWQAFTAPLFSGAQN